MNGFNVGKASIFYQMKGLDNVTFMTQKPQIFNNKCCSLAKDITIYNGDSVKAQFYIDERGFNTLFLKSCSDDFKDKAEWILNKFKQFKISNIDFGTYENNKIGRGEGKENLYAHDFIIWLNKQI